MADNNAFVLFEDIKNTLKGIENKVEQLGGNRSNEQSEGTSSSVHKQVDETLRQNHEQNRQLLQKFAGRQIEELKKIATRLQEMVVFVNENANSSQPVIMERKLNVSFSTDKGFWAIMLSITLNILLLVALYIERQPDYDRVDNDLKYRYIRMKGEADTDRINELEDIFELNRNNERIQQMKEDVEKYEETVRKQAVISEQAKRKEREAARLDSIAKTVKRK
jgi:hypothetical protein